MSVEAKEGAGCLDPLELDRLHSGAHGRPELEPMVRLVSC